MTEEATEQKRREILKAAHHVFATRGYHRARIQDIAAELGMGHGTFYRYFRNKLDIFVHVIDEGLARVATIIAEEDPTNTCDLDGLRALLERVSARLVKLFVLEEPHLGKLLFEEAPGIDPAITRRLQAAYDTFGDYARLYLEHGVARGFLRDDVDCAVAGRAVLAMVMEAIRESHRAEDPTTTSHLWTQVVLDMLLCGMMRKSS